MHIIICNIVPCSLYKNIYVTSLPVYPQPLLFFQILILQNVF